MRLTTYALLGLLGLFIVGGIGYYVAEKRPPKHVPPITESAASAEAAALQRLLATPLLDLQGNSVTLSNWRGQILVVNFWATWCPPCREELPGFSRQQTKFRGKGVQFVGIALDSTDKVRVFAEKYPVTFPLLVDEQQELTAL